MLPTMRVLVTGDTHGHALPPELLQAAAVAALVLHTGDVLEPEALTALGGPARVRAVAGNCDPVTLGLPERLLLTVAGRRIGLTHGHLGAGRTTPARALGAFRPGEAEVVVFGHSHQALVEWRDGVLLVNPGSATERRRSPFASFAWLDVACDGGLRARIVPISPPA